MGKYTPGPWAVCSSYTAGRIIVKAPQPTNRVLAGFGSEDEPLDDIDWANARLIAAAPELLEALKAALKVIEGYCDHWEQDVYEKAQAAIAKAEGESNAG